MRGSEAPRGNFDGGGQGFDGAPSLALPPMTPMVKRVVIATLGFQALFFTLHLIAPGVARGIADWFSINPDVWVDYKAPALWQLVTSGFLHDPTSIFHVLWNMLQLYFFGTLLESIVGSRRFLYVYFGALIAGSFLHLVAELIGGAPYASAIGASGAVMGVIAAAAVLRPHSRVLLIFIPIPLWVLAVGLVSIDFFSALSAWASGSRTFVAHWAHIGGAVFGGLAAWRGWIWIDWRDRFAKRRAEKVEERRQDDDQRLDELLAKVHKDGIQSLTKAEREFLNRMSNRRK